jgi:hypothetical protein
MLLDYTKSHLGVYLSLLSAIVAFISSGRGPPLESLPARCSTSVWYSWRWLADGGVVGATVVGQNGYETFRMEKTGPGSLKLMGGEAWASFGTLAILGRGHNDDLALGVFVRRRRRTSS